MATMTFLRPARKRFLLIRILESEISPPKRSKKLRCLTLARTATATYSMCFNATSQRIRDERNRDWCMEAATRAPGICRYPDRRQGALGVRCVCYRLGLAKLASPLADNSTMALTSMEATAPREGLVHSKGAPPRNSAPVTELRSPSRGYRSLSGVEELGS